MPKANTIPRCIKQERKCAINSAPTARVHLIDLPDGDKVFRGAKAGEPAPVDAKRLRGLEAENHRLKKLPAQRDMDISVREEIYAAKW